MIDDSLLESLGREEGETHRAWSALVEYAEMGWREDGARMARSVRVLARDKHHSYRVVCQWSSQFNWVARVEAYDRAVDAWRTRLWQDRRKLVDERDYQEGEALRVLGMRGLVQNKTAMDEGVVMAPVNVSRLIVEGSKLQRLATGAPTERTEQQLSPDYVKLLDDIFGKKDKPADADRSTD